MNEEIAVATGPDSLPAPPKPRAAAARQAKGVGATWTAEQIGAAAAVTLRLAEIGVGLGYLPREAMRRACSVVLDAGGPDLRALVRAANAASTLMQDASSSSAAELTAWELRKKFLQVFERREKLTVAEVVEALQLGAQPGTTQRVVQLLRRLKWHPVQNRATNYRSLYFNPLYLGGGPGA